MRKWRVVAVGVTAAEGFWKMMVAEILCCGFRGGHRGMCEEEGEWRFGGGKWRRRKGGKGVKRKSNGWTDGWVL